MTEIVPIIVAEDEVTVAGFIGNVDLNLDVGETGRRGSVIFVGDGSPPDTPPDGDPIFEGVNTFLINDLYIEQDDPALPLWQYQNGTPDQWVEILELAEDSIGVSPTATDNAVVRFDGTTGADVQNSGVLIDDSGNMTIPSALTVATTINGVYVESFAGAGSFSLSRTGTALGSATGSGNTAIGETSLVNMTTGTNNTALGAGAGKYASGTDQTFIGANAGCPDGVLGNSTVANAGVTLIGNDTWGRNGTYVVAVGDHAKADATQAIAIGRYSEATASASIAIGPFADATGYGSFALGWLSEATADGSVAIGHDHLGNGASSTVQDEFVLGTSNHTVFTPGTWAVGSGSGPTITSGAGVPSSTEPSGSIYLRTDGTGANQQAYVKTDDSPGTTWSAMSGSIGLPTIGSSTDDAVVTWDGTGGDVVQNSLVTISSAGLMQVPDDLQVGNGSAASPSLTFVSDTDTGIWRYAADTLSVSTSGSERIRVANSTTTIYNDLVVNDDLRNAARRVKNVATASSGPVTLGATDHIHIATSGTYTVSLPAVGTTGAEYTVKNAGSGVVTVDADSSETIDGALSVDLNQYDSITVIDNGTEWSVL